MTSFPHITTRLTYGGLAIGCMSWGLAWTKFCTSSPPAQGISRRGDYMSAASMHELAYRLLVRWLHELEERVMGAAPRSLGRALHSARVL